jgi:hypothetical protein
MSVARRGEQRAAAAGCVGPDRQRPTRSSTSSPITAWTGRVPKSTRSTRPQYRDLDCAFSGTAQTLTIQQGDKYRLRPVTVTVKIP